MVRSAARGGVAIRGGVPAGARRPTTLHVHPANPVGRHVHVGAHRPGVATALSGSIVGHRRLSPPAAVAVNPGVDRWPCMAYLSGIGTVNVACPDGSLMGYLKPFAWGAGDSLVINGTAEV